MNHTIHKYEIEVKDINMINMPVGAEILCVQVQYKIPCIWAKVDNNPTEFKKRFFRLIGTWHFVPYDETLEYIGTFQLHDGRFVGHLFETQKL